jgi:hypothetical protein
VPAFMERRSFTMMVGTPTLDDSKCFGRCIQTRHVILVGFLK